MTEPVIYPRHWEADVVASDGGVLHLRPILPSDADDLLAFHSRLSDRTRYLRYFGPYPHIPPRDLKRFVEVDHHDQVAFVCLLGSEIVAVGRYVRLDDTASAEVAFVVRDDHQGRGLGSILLEHLAAAAGESGVQRFVAEVLVENNTMVRVFRDAGYQVSREFADGVLHLEFDVEATERSLAVRNAREQAAEARGVHNVLHPGSVAVIGASTDPAKIGHAVLANLLRGNFTGPVYPVHPDARSVRGVRAYPSVTDIPDDVDLAVVAVPAALVDDVLDSCLVKGVRALVVLSAGFAEADADGSRAQRHLVTQARSHGMRVIGPNALGVINTDPAVSLNATLAPDLPGLGRVGFFCQSGALGIAILAGLASRGLGLSTFVSAGNRADLSGNDLLQYWQTDPDTDVVLLYLETFGNPRKFARLARRLARQKPVVAVKSGRHTAPLPAFGASMVPVDEASVQVLFEQSGVIRVQTLPQLFDTALLLAYQPLPTGPRVAVVGNSSALGVLVCDALLDEGLVPAGAPADIGASAAPERFAEAVATAVADPEVDALIAVFVPPLAIPVGEYARALRRAATDAGKPVLTTFLGAEGILEELAAPGPDGRPGPGSVPSYSSPERAVATLARVLRYAQWRDGPVGDYVRPDGIRREDARELVERCVPADGAGVQLDDQDALALLACYGIEVTAFRMAGSASSAVQAADELGYPVTLKGVGEKWQRPELIGVRLDLGSADAVTAAYRDLVGVTGETELIVQRMAPKGPSCGLAVVDDPSFGSLLSFGLSGIATELLGDRAHRVVPLSTRDAHELIRAPRAAPLLDGYGGAERADLAALEQLALRVSALAEDIPELRSLRLQPVLAAPTAASVTAARIVLGPPPSQLDGGPRRLR
ncbi:bifunctional GNAT family N-acetyltransferase/acetate--CoA ligase family protein [Pseudonocardia spinosispora]|uniref:bifunctional acetate--CoA ligase family protein/GNAT family N-acetyltransferase n=1 Tax=Pseudonocardia spinosispora TaxID=103441 RepID=UPI0004199EB9|nr:bifunctional GNAT family N-acetyltransferase/acetate--CoA ligase family protein [Pseudonocardia spinosispora]